MRRAPRRGRSLLAAGSTPAFSLLELLVVIGIIALLTALLLGVLSRARGAAKSVQCISNLRQIGHAMLDYSSANNTKLPDPHAAGVSWEQCLSLYVSDDQLFRCPADDELYPVVGSSYDWRDTGDPVTTLAGQSIESVIRSDAVLAFESLPGWHDKGTMNAVMLDGSARQMDKVECLNDLQRPLRASDLRQK